MAEIGQLSKVEDALRGRRRQLYARIVEAS
jgi:hypothetical protein